MKGLNTPYKKNQITVHNLKKFEKNMFASTIKYR